MTKFILSLIMLFSVSAFARECGVTDIKNYVSQFTQEGLDSYCRNHGGSVASISASRPARSLISNSYFISSKYVVKCVNNHTFVGTLNLDPTTCKNTTAEYEDTLEIYRK
jgi:hypothetical protein